MGETLARIALGSWAALLTAAGIYLLTHPKFSEEFYDYEGKWLRWFYRLMTVGSGVVAIGLGAAFLYQAFAWPN